MYPACHLLNYDLKTYVAYDSTVNVCTSSNFTYPHPEDIKMNEIGKSLSFDSSF